MFTTLQNNICYMTILYVTLWREGLYIGNNGYQIKLIYSFVY